MKILAEKATPSSWRKIAWAMILSMSVLSLRVHAQQSQQFVPFYDFMHQVATADAAKFLAQPQTKVQDAASFEAMRQHILSMYQGAHVSNSFALDGQTFDCVPVNEQPSVRLGAQTNIATPPPLSAIKAANGGPDHAVTSQVAADQKVDKFGNSIGCQAGNIPMRRITLDEMSHFANLRAFFDKGPDGKGRALKGEDMNALAPAHKYAYTYQYVNNLGGDSALNLWSPYVNNVWFIGEVFSLSQQWYVGWGTGSTQTAEVGWQNYPAKYGSENSALFIYWTADNYNKTGCYNLDCAGFVQTNGSWYLGSGFSNYSTSGGPQYSFEAQYYLYAGNWWLALGGSWIGYYPGSVYGSGQMRYNAQLIEYGGESVGSWIWPPEGSGAWASSGWSYAAYQRNVWYRDTAGSTWWANLSVAQPSPACYSIAGPYYSTSPGWGRYFYMGGPGGTGC